MLVEKIGYVGEIVSISGRTTAVVRLHSSRYAHAQQLMCMRWSTVMRQLLSKLMPHPPTENIRNTKTGCIHYKENTPRNLNILCYDNIVIPLLPLLSQWVEGTVGTTIVVITPTDGLRQTLVGI